MWAEDSDALECDLAETYGLLDLHDVSVRKLAVLACGLRDDSRIKKKLSGVAVDTSLLLLAHAVDRLSWLVWAKTKDGQKGRNKPKSVVDALLQRNDSEIEKIDSDVFDSIDAFKRERERVLERIKEGETNA